MKRTEIAGAPERRVFSAPFEIRSGKTADDLELEGYAATFDEPYDIWGGPPNGFREIVDSKAFNATLARSPDVHLLINHEGMPLARTKSGTLSLAADDHGLKVNATLDRQDPDVQRLERKMGRGDIDEMSFAFRTIRDEWDHDEEERRLLEVSIDKGDVSVVNFGANPSTSSTLTDALRALAGVEVDSEMLAEIRAHSDDLVAARKTLTVIIREISPQTPQFLSLAEARALLEQD